MRHRPQLRSVCKSPFRAFLWRLWVCGWHGREEGREERGRVRRRHLHALTLSPLLSRPSRLYLPGLFRAIFGGGIRTVLLRDRRRLASEGIDRTAAQLW